MHTYIQTIYSVVLVVQLFGSGNVYECRSIGYRQLKVHVQANPYNMYMCIAQASIQIHLCCILALPSVFTCVNSDVFA